MPLVLAKGSKTPGHSDENNGAVASLPRNQRCWHNHPVCLECSRACRIASERSTLLALRFRGRFYSWQKSHRFRNSNAVGTAALAATVPPTPVASLPKHQRAREGIRDQGHHINSYADTRMPATDRVSCVRETTYGEVPLKTK